MTRHALLALGLWFSLSGCAPKAPPPSPSPVAEPATAAPPAAPDPAASTGAPAQTADEQRGELLRLLESKSPDDARAAIEKLNRLAAERPEDARIPYNQGVAWLTIGDAGEARKRFLRATDVDPKLGAAWLNLGALSERAGELDRAAQSYQAGLRYSPDDNSLAVAYAGVLRQQRKYEEAERLCRDVVRRDSNNIRAYDELGQIFIARGDYGLAKFVYDRAFYSVPGAQDDPAMHAHFGQVLLATSNKVKAREEMEKAVAMDPGLVSARLTLSGFHMDNHDWNATLATLEPARDLAPNNASIRMNLGAAYRGLGRVEDAKASWEKALELDPANPDPLLNLAILYGDTLKDYPLALSTIDAYLAKGGTRTALAKDWRAALEEAKKRFDRAQELKKRKDEQRKKAEERERLAAEAAARIKAEEEAAARQQQEEAARGAQQPAPAPTPDTAAATPVPAAPAPDPAQQQWPPAQEPTPAPPAAVPAPAQEPAPAAADPWGGSPAAANPSAIGKACSARGGCGDPGLECAQDAVCRQAGATGTYGEGIGCVVSADCAFGLICNANACATPAAAPAPGGDSPWGSP